ncbi:MAG: flagellar biosynthesis protein FliQ [Acidaminococcales bacterium]|jgi:flagellar biosynthetic protein FliQ|nr:flagellar biosynthesis protein FliQ [Acidaminococcales bacterium]
MNVDYAVQVGRDALLIVMLVSAPMLGLGMLVGILVSVFQATTQIQEQTLVFIPKILAVFVGIVIFGSAMLNMLIGFTRQIFENLPAMIK